MSVKVCGSVPVTRPLVDSETVQLYFCMFKSVIEKTKISYFVSDV